MRSMCRSALGVMTLASFLAASAGAQISSGAAPGSPGPQGAATSGRTSGSGSTTATTEFKTETQAKAHCPGDTVVWANPHSKVYHFSGTKDYGTTKNGAYMCEKETAAAGFHAAKNEQHP
jgi:hypothetical protein